MAEMAEMFPTARAQDIVRVRALIREFLRATPASELDAALVWRDADGHLRRLTRGQMTRRVESFRPRMRRIVEQQFIARRTREAVADDLAISVKTLERDQNEALDALAADAEILRDGIRDGVRESA